MAGGDFDEFDEIDEIDFTPPSEKRKREQPTEVDRELHPPPPADPGGEPEAQAPPDLSRFVERPRRRRAEAEAGAAAEAGQPDEAPPRKPRVAFLGNETLRRVLSAVPAIVFAIVIIAVGGPLFAGSMVVMALLGMREFLGMTEDSRPLSIAGYLTVAGMIVAAYLGDSYNVLMALACGFPLCFLAAAQRGNHR
ncbi:MAG: hypothetical protein ABR536_03435, partial [Solirubrobacterales bacterium]